MCFILNNFSSLCPQVKIHGIRSAANPTQGELTQTLHLYLQSPVCSPHRHHTPAYLCLYEGQHACGSLQFSSLLVPNPSSCSSASTYWSVTCVFLFFACQIALPYFLVIMNDTLLLSGFSRILFKTWVFFQSQVTVGYILQRVSLKLCYSRATTVFSLRLIWTPCVLWGLSLLLVLEPLAVPRELQERYIYCAIYSSTWLSSSCCP